MRPAISLIVLLVLISCNPQQETKPVSQVSSSSTSTSRWSAGSFPLNLKISDSFSSDETTAIQSLGTAWEVALNNQVNFFDNSARTPNIDSTNMNTYEDGVFGIYKNDHWPSDLPINALAVTQIFGVRRGQGTPLEYIEISHADILVNYQSFSFSHNHAFGYDLKTVLLHEMGHFIGLFHNGVDAQTVMAPYISSWTEKRTPYAADASKLTALYSLSGGSGSGSQAISASDISNKNAKAALEIGAPVRIIIELMSNGTCMHYENSKLVQTH